MSAAAQWLAPTVISSLIAGGVAVATHFSSAQAKKTENREDIRTEAFDQAKAYYTDVIERQQTELETMRTQISDALKRLDAAEDAADQARAAVRTLRVELEHRDARIADLTARMMRGRVGDE